MKIKDDAIFLKDQRGLHMTQQGKEGERGNQQGVECASIYHNKRQIENQRGDSQWNSDLSWLFDLAFYNRGIVSIT